MAQKSAARRGRKASSSGSKDSVELGHNGEYRPAKKPSPEGVEGSQSDHVRTGSKPAEEEAAATLALVELAAGGYGTTEPSAAQPKPTTAEPTSSSQDDGGQMSSKYSTSRRQEEMAKRLPALDEEEEKESEEESTEAPGPNQQPKGKRDSGRVTRSQQPKVPAPTEQPGKEGAQPSEPKKPKSKKITPAPLQEHHSKSKKPKSKKITPAPLQQQQPRESKKPKSKKITPAVAGGDGTTEPSAQPKPTTAEPTSSSGNDAGQMSSKYSTSRRQEEMAKKLDPLVEEEKGSGDGSTEAPGPNPQPKRKRDSGRVTRSQQPVVPAPTEQRGKEGAQPSESKKLTPEQLQQQPSKSKKPKSKKITPPPLEHQDEKIPQPCESEMPKSKRIRVTRSEQPKVPAPTEQRGKEVAQPSESKKPKSKKITRPPLQQQDEEPCESEMPKSKRIRRTWNPSDEVRILKALLKHRRKQGKLPAPDNDDFFDSILKRLEDKSWNRYNIKDKVRSLMRRYRSYVAPTTDHEKRVHHLSNRVWGNLLATHAANGNNGDGEHDEGEHAMAMAEDGGGQTVDKKSFQEKCEVYPLLGQEVTRLAELQPALRSSFAVLDGEKAILMEKKLDKLKWKELRIQAEMEAKVEAPKARIRVELINVLSGVSKKI